MTTIYGLFINGNYVYIGQTRRTLKERNREHKSNCYNKNKCSYEYSKYKKIRNELKIDKDQYYDRVKIQQIYSNVPDNYAGIMEDFIINLYRDFGYELLNENQGVNYSICIHKKQKVMCIICDGSQVCIHKRQIQYCKDCNGTSVCIHKKQRRTCEVCSPVICNVCDKTYSKSYIKRHMKRH